MDGALDELETAFAQLDRRPAVFDREIREHVGRWRLPEPVPADEVIAAFKRHAAFVVDDANVVIPLHEPDSAALTGEYLVYYPDHLVPAVVYYDYARDALARIPLAEFDRTYPAWRLRFWHPSYEPPTQPTYLDATDADGTPPAATAETSQQEDGQPQRAMATGTASDPPDATPGDADGAVEAVSLDSDAADAAGVESVDPLPDDGRPFLDELRSMVATQQVRTREDARGMFARLAPAQFFEQAGGIPEVVTAGIETDDYGQQVVRLRIPSDAVDGPVDIPREYGIYPGTEVLLDAVDDLEGFPAEAEVVAIEGRQLSVAVYWDRGETAPRLSAFELEADNRFVVGELHNPVPFDRKREAIDTIADDDRKRGWLSGAAPLAFDDGLDVSVNRARLNDHQYRAAHRALQSRDVCCIHGPPGTGKTRTLVEVIRSACADGKRVLACAHSNQAVDNLLVGDSTADRVDPSSLHAAAEDGELTVARAGDHSTNDLVVETYADNDLYQSDVVCATMSGAHRFGTDIFDLAVVDEATQASIPATLIPAVRAERLVLAGDHKQLPPYHAGERDDDEDMAVSLFEHFIEIYGEGIVTTLRTQYRMNEAIAAFPNRAFYDGVLTHGPRNRTWTIDALPPLEAYHVAGEEAKTPSQSYYNDREAVVVAAEVAQLLDRGIVPADIGVITPYTGQIGKIRGRLRALDTSGIDDLDIATVDAFQGGERDVIIVSFVRSNPQGFSGFLTFPNEGPRRLNVALTRARRRCVLVGNFDTLRTRAPDRRPGESAAGVYHDLYEHLEATDSFAEPPEV